VAKQWTSTKKSRWVRTSIRRQGSSNAFYNADSARVNHWSNEST